MWKKWRAGEISLGQLLRHDFQIKIHKKALLYALLFFALPNLFFLLVALPFGYARPLINIDYVPASLLMTLPFRWAPIVAMLVLLPAMLFDAMMVVMQLFPFANFGALIYLAPFIWQAPARYLWMSGLFLSYFLLFPFFYRWLQKKRPARWTSALMLSGFWLLFVYFFGDRLFYHRVPPQFFGHHNYQVAHSQFQLYRDNHGTDFLKALNQEPELLPGQEEYASKRFFKDGEALPRSRKLLLIVAESWGQAREESVTRALLEKIEAQREHLEFIEQGYFDFYGATVKGELRELCQLAIDDQSGFALERVDAAAFAQCLPNRLRQAGYATYAMHGAGRLFYGRYAWYPKAGFEKNYFSEDLLNSRRCTPFKGVCDSELWPLIVEAFGQHERIFYYWLTLTTHAEWSPRDLRRPRLDCEEHGLYAGDICNSFRLHAQFFDELSEIIQRPEMKGAEVIVVGDHMPPVVTTQPLHHNLRWQDVAWLHFKIKDEESASGSSQ